MTKNDEILYINNKYKSFQVQTHLLPAYKGQFYLVFYSISII